MQVIDQTMWPKINLKYKNNSECTKLITYNKLQYSVKQKKSLSHKFTNYVQL